VQQIELAGKKGSIYSSAVTEPLEIYAADRKKLIYKRKIG
jgi:hypothetical protein